jgi:hypothetical protein
VSDEQEAPAPQQDSVPPRDEPVPAPLDAAPDTVPPPAYQPLPLDDEWAVEIRKRYA